MAVASTSQLTAAACSPRATTGTLSSDGNGACNGTGPARGFPTGHRWSAIGTGNASTVIVILVQCMSNGIDNDATSTMAQDVMCTWGFLTRKRFKPTHTMLP